MNKSAPAHCFLEKDRSLAITLTLYFGISFGVAAIWRVSSALKEICFYVSTGVWTEAFSLLLSSLSDQAVLQITALLRVCCCFLWSTLQYGCLSLRQMQFLPKRKSITSSRCSFTQLSSYRKVNYDERANQIGPVYHHCLPAVDN